MKSQKKSVTAHEMIHSSKLVNPCAFVRSYLDRKFKTVRRCDAVKFFESNGIATYTARTQYQKYYAKVNAPKVTAKKSKGAKGAKVNAPKVKHVAPVAHVAVAA